MVRQEYNTNTAIKNRAEAEKRKNRVVLVVAVDYTGAGL
jgi:hypothetical protein